MNRQDEQKINAKCKLDSEYYMDSFKEEGDSLETKIQRKEKTVCFKVIDHEGNLSACLKLLNILLCIISSYIYAWIACFGTERDGQLFNLFIIFEFLFFIIMVSNFFTDFIQEGEMSHVTDT